MHICRTSVNIRYQVQKHIFQCGTCTQTLPSRRSSLYVSVENNTGPIYATHSPEAISFFGTNTSVLLHWYEHRPLHDPHLRHCSYIPTVSYLVTLHQLTKLIPTTRAPHDYCINRRRFATTGTSFIVYIAVICVSLLVIDRTARLVHTNIQR